MASALLTSMKALMAKSCAERLVSNGYTPSQADSWSSGSAGGSYLLQVGPRLAAELLCVNTAVCANSAPVHTDGPYLFENIPLCFAASFLKVSGCLWVWGALYLSRDSFLICQFQLRLLGDVSCLQPGLYLEGSSMSLLIVVFPQ